MTRCTGDMAHISSTQSNTLPSYISPLLIATLERSDTANNIDTPPRTMTQSHILGIATQFPELQNTVEGTEAFFKKWAKPSEGQVHSSSLALCFCCSSLSNIRVAY
jgi:hypothetical protein